MESLKCPVSSFLETHWLIMAITTCLILLLKSTTSHMVSTFLMAQPEGFATAAPPLIYLVCTFNFSLPSLLVIELMTLLFLGCRLCAFIKGCWITLCSSPFWGVLLFDDEHSSSIYTVLISEQLNLFGSLPHLKNNVSGCPHHISNYSKFFWSSWMPKFVHNNCITW